MPPLQSAILLKRQAVAAGFYLLQIDKWSWFLYSDMNDVIKLQKKQISINFRFVTSWMLHLSYLKPTPLRSPIAQSI